MKKFAHGGARPGAGRRPKYELLFKLTVGSLCEFMLRDTTKRAAQYELSRLFGKPGARESLSDLHYQWRKGRIDIEARLHWLMTDDGVQYLEDVKTEIAALNSIEQTGIETNRLFLVSAKPPYGSRKLIRRLVAEKYSLTENEVRYLWDEFIKFERKQKSKT